MAVKRICVGFQVLLLTGASWQTAVHSSTAGETNGLQIVSVKKIWDHAPHNAFTDLVRFQHKWWCAFRESQAHVGGNGRIRVLVSVDGDKWASAALLKEEGIDLRDPKLSIAPDQRLILNLGGSVYEQKVLKERQSRAAFSQDGTNWNAPQRILEKGDWLWRLTWQNGVGYGIAYKSGTARPAQKSNVHDGMTARLVSTRDGLSYEQVTQLEIPGSPNESTVRFLGNGDCVALVRREVDDKQAWIGKSHAPYKKWDWHSAGMRIGGPNFVVLKDGPLIAGGRKTDSASSQSRAFVGAMTMHSVHPEVILPSGGDCSYPGMVWQDGVLWLSYYSSHEGKTAIYLAKLIYLP